LGLVKREFPDVRLVTLDRNAGFGAALNRGVATSGADLLVFLNNDAVADPGFISALLDTRAETGAAMLAACLRQPNGTIDSHGVEIDVALNAYDVGRGDPYPVPASTAYKPLAPTGGAAAFDRAAFDEVGGFDERIFAYLEDVDLGIRLRLAGAECALARAAFAWHLHASTLGSGSSAKNELLARSRSFLLWKYGANLSLGARSRGLANDWVVYAGQAVIDRNLAGPRARLAGWRSRVGQRRPPPDPGFASLPMSAIGLLGGLRRRLARRR
jgi:GT2 family glycosyltransferase